MVYLSQPIFQPASLPFQQCHASTLVEAPNSDLLAAWFAGTCEGHPDVAIWLARFRKGKWDTAVKVVEVPGIPLWNPVLFRDRKDRLWLFYKVGPTIPAWTGAYLRSTDGGFHWSSPTYLPAGLLGPAKNKPITLSNGDILCGTSAETWQSWTCWVEISRDEGESWQRCGPIAWPVQPADLQTPVSAFREEPQHQRILPDSYPGVIQPTLWEYEPGRLKMLMRATRQVGFICQAFSEDSGRTWTAPEPTALPNPNSGLDAVRLADGQLALVFNPTQDARSPLAIALSQDNGVTWPFQRLIETQPGELSYPSIIQTSDGLLNLTYTHQRSGIQHVTVDVEWVRSK